MTPGPATAAKPEPPADGWGPDPPPLTAAEIEDLRRNGMDVSESVENRIAEPEAEPGPGR